LHPVILTLGWAMAGLAVVGTVYTAAAAFLTLRFMTGAKWPDAPWPDVTIIKPLHGAIPGLRENLERFCEQDYPGQVQIVFGVHDAEDGAVAVVRALQAAHPAADITLVVDPRVHGVNLKVSNLINIAARVKHPVLVLSDADIHVERDYLRAVTGALSAPGVDLVSCLYVGKSDGGAWSTLSALAIDYHFLPSVVVGQALNLAHPCFGSTIALRADMLQRIGGFEAFADHLADDYEIGRAVRAAGGRIAVPPMVVSHLCPEASAPALLDHELRWGRTVRQIDPLGYAGSLITYPFPLALAAGGFLGFNAESVGLIFTTLGVRIALKACIDAATSARAGPFWLVPLRDVLSFCVFIASFAVNTVGWRGSRFRVGRGGVLSNSKGS
jgi:ceramide glucosyltransferase